MADTLSSKTLRGGNLPQGSLGTFPPRKDAVGKDSDRAKIAKVIRMRDGA